jgi:outer membrane lipoprotein-sorting protein
MLRLINFPLPAKAWVKNMASKQIIIFLLITIYSLVGRATESPTKELLEQLASCYQKIIPFKLDFELINYRDQENYQSLVGTYYMANVNQFRVDFAEQEIIFDGQWLWSYDQTNNQVVVETLDPQSSLTFIFNLLNGNYQSFKAEITKSNKKDSLIVVELQTADENKYFKKIYLMIERISIQLKSVIYYDFQDLKTELKLAVPERIETSEAATLFDTQQFGSKEIIDLRP